MTSTTAPYSGSEWPKVAVRSSAMTTRGSRIKRERQRRRMSQMDLHKATDVGLRTIGRVEAGEAENSPSIEVLEAHLGIADGSVSQDRPARTEDEQPPTVARAMEHLAEAMRLLAQVESRSGDHAVGEGRQVRWPTSAMPSAQRKQGPSQEDHSREVQ